MTSEICSSELMTTLAKMAVEKIKNFTAETGEEMIYFQSGSLKIARTAEHEQQLRRDVERGQKLGVDVDFVSAAKARQLMPFFEPAGIRAVTYARDDLYLEPGQLPRGYARATANLPPAFRIDDLPLDLSVLRRLIGQVVDQFPILREIAIKEHRGGLPTMTADGEHIVGPLAELRGFYVAGGCCVGGLSIAPI